MYEFVSNDHEISLKEIANDPVNGAVISKHAPGTVFHGDYLRFIPVDMEFGRIGDFALHVTEAGGVAVDGWVNVVYKGVKYGDIVAVDSPKALRPLRVVLENPGEDWPYVPE